MHGLHASESHARLRMLQRNSHTIREALGLPVLFRTIRKNPNSLNLQVE
jgi:hypothetical protein